MMSFAEMAAVFCAPKPPRTDLFPHGQHVFFWDTEVVTIKTDPRPQRVRGVNQGLGAFNSRLIEVAVVDFRGALVVHANLYWETLQPSFPGVCVSSAWQDEARCCTIEELLVAMTNAMPRGSIIFEHGTDVDCTHVSMLLEDIDPQSPVLQAFLAMNYVAVCTATLKGFTVGEPPEFVFDALRGDKGGLNKLHVTASLVLGLKVYPDGGVHRRRLNPFEIFSFVKAVSEGGLDSYLFFRDVFCTTEVKADHCGTKNGDLQILQIPDVGVSLDVTAVDDLVCSKGLGRYWTQNHHEAMPAQQTIRKSWTHQQRCLQFHTAAHDAGVLRSTLVVQCLRWFFWFHSTIQKSRTNTPPVRYLDKTKDQKVAWHRVGQTEEAGSGGAALLDDSYTFDVHAPREIRSSISIGLGFALMTKHETEAIMPSTESVFRLLSVVGNRVRGKSLGPSSKKNKRGGPTDRLDPQPLSYEAKRLKMFDVSSQTLDAEAVSAWLETRGVPDDQAKNVPTMVITPAHFRFLVKEPPLGQGLANSRLLSYLRDSYQPEQRWFVPERPSSTHDRCLHYIFCCTATRSNATNLKRRLRYMTNELALHTVAAGLSVNLCKLCGCTNKAALSTVYDLYKKQPETRQLEENLRLPQARALLLVISSAVNAKAKATTVATLLAAVLTHMNRTWTRMDDV
jgi:hypothetical protein